MLVNRVKPFALRWAITITVLLIFAGLAVPGCISVPTAESFPTKEEVDVRSVKASLFEIAGTAAAKATITVENRWDRDVWVSIEDAGIEVTKQDGTQYVVPVQVDNRYFFLPYGSTQKVIIYASNVPFHYTYNPKTGKLVPKLCLRAFASCKGTARFLLGLIPYTATFIKQVPLSPEVPLKEEQLLRQVKQIFVR